MGLTDLIAKFSGSGKTVLEQNLRSRFQSIYDYLRGLLEIRIFTANSQNFGHQASTVNILRNLIRMRDLQLIPAPEYSGPLLGEEAAPSGECAGGGFDRLTRPGGAEARNEGDGGSGRRIDDRRRGLAYPLTVDQTLLTNQSLRGLKDRCTHSECSRASTILG